MSVRLESPDQIHKLDQKIKEKISKEYISIQTNIDDVSNLIERRRKHVINLGSLYEDRINLGTLKAEDGDPIKIHQICRQVYKDLKDNHIPLASYRTIARYMPKKWKKPYHFEKVDNHVDKDGNPTGLNAKVITLVNPDKHTLSENMEKIDNIEDLSADGTPYEVSQAAFDEICDIFNQARSQSKNLSELQPAMISAIVLKSKEIYDASKNYCHQYNVKIPGEKKPNTSSVSLNIQKPAYRKNMIVDEVGLLQKDWAVMKKKLGHMRFTKEEEYFYWEAIRALRLFIRPQVNEKYRRNWSGYAKLMQLILQKNVSGVAKRDTLSPGEVYDPSQDKYVPLVEIQKEMEENGLTSGKMTKLKGITRNHLRNMNNKIPEIFLDFMVDMPFLGGLSDLFENKLQPIRTGKAIMISENR